MEARDIPDEEVPDYATKIWIGPPPGQEESIEGVEAIAYMAALPDFSQVVARAVRIELDPGDLEHLAAKGHFWLTFIGEVVVPFALNLDLPEPADVQGSSDEDLATASDETPAQPPVDPTEGIGL